MSVSLMQSRVTCLTSHSPSLPFPDLMCYNQIEPENHNAEFESDLIVEN